MIPHILWEQDPIPLSQRTCSQSKTASIAGTGSRNPPLTKPGAAHGPCPKVLFRLAPWPSRLRRGGEYIFPIPSGQTPDSPDASGLYLPDF